MADLASLIVRLEAETARFRADLQRAENRLRSLEGAANSASNTIKRALGGALAYFSGRAIVGFLKGTIDAADHLNDLSKATGVSVEALSELQFAAEQSGTDLDGLTTGLRKLSKVAIDAASGSKSAAAAFKAIGVSVRDTNGSIKSTEALLLDVADVFSQYRDGAEKSAVAQEIFGKSGATLIPFLNEGKRGIAALRAEAERLGLTVSGKTAQAADDFNDKLSKLQSQANGLGRQVAEKLLPALTDIVNALSDLAADKDNVRGFIDGLSTALRSLAYVAVATGDTFGDVGRYLGGFAAYTAQVLKGNFAEAETIQADFLKDAIAAEAATTQTLERIWNDRAGAYNDALAKYKFEPGRGGPTSRRGGDKTGAKGKFLQAIPFAEDNGAADELKKQIDKANDLTRTAGETVLADYAEKVKALDFLRDKAGLGIKEYADRLKAAQTDLLKELSQASPGEEAAKKEAERLKDLEEQTRTTAGAILATYKETRAALDELLAKQIIDPAEFKARLKQTQTELLAAISQAPVEAEAKKINEFQLEAARNTQDIIAGTFEDLALGVDTSLGSIAKSFGIMIVKLAAQAAAANLAGKLFGDAATGGTTGGGGIVGTALGALTSYFGGTKDSGGRGYPGMAYSIGTGAQPETFVPDSAGTFYPAGKGQTVINFTIAGDMPITRRTQMQIAAAASKGVQRGNRRNN